MAERLRLKLVHDMLDGQLRDRHGKRIGRIDDIELEQRADGSLFVAGILIGGPVRDARAGRWASIVSHLVNRIAGAQAAMSRIPFGKVREIADTITLDVEGDTLPSSHLEIWLRDHVVCRLPASGGERK